MTKTFLVTGATDGIGRATAAALLAHGQRVLVHGRGTARAESAARDLARAAGAGEAVPVWGDFADLGAVVDLAAQVRATVPGLDVLINNAGLYAKERRLSKDGIELTLAVNYYAPWLLTDCLLPLVTATPAARIVIVSSMTHAGASLDFADLDLHHGWDAYGAYARSKLMNLLHARALARRLAGTTVNALHPGVIGTKLLRAGFGMGGGTVEDGARTSLHLALAAEVAGVSGAYFVDCRRREPSAAARDEALAEHLWQHTVERLAPWLATRAGST